MSLGERDIGDLSPEERDELAQALRRLKTSVERYSVFEARAPLGAGDVVPRSIEEMLAAQKEVQAAEAELWDVRERLLGWHRPAWAPAATQVTDWFSEEDSIYDEVEPPHAAV